MRIIAGEFRGRKLLAPDDDATRPITDRAKQSLFDILAPVIEGSVVYDIFSGTGSLGLECLSRGARAVVFFESHRPALARLRRNIETIGVQKRSTVLSGDVFRYFDAESRRTTTPPADLLFLDPPYRYLNDQPADLLRMVQVMAASHMAADAIVVFRHDAADSLAVPPLQTFDQRAYGSMMIELMRAGAPDQQTQAAATT